MNPSKAAPKYARSLLLLLLLSVFAISTSAAGGTNVSQQQRGYSRLDDISRAYGQLLARDLTGTGGACVRNSDCKTNS
ncbi:hypothetical protein CF319_g8693 [Tilletia indica]|nr:hypothetical protein CF319_g8693 [Tilletia indica]